MGKQQNDVTSKPYGPLHPKPANPGVDPRTIHQPPVRGPRVDPRTGTRK